MVKTNSKESLSQEMDYSFLCKVFVLCFYVYLQIELQKTFWMMDLEYGRYKQTKS